MRLTMMFLVALAMSTGLPAADAAVPSRPGSRFFDCRGCPELVVVPAGEFTMGAEGGEEGRPEGPPHRVRIVRPFALGRTEVTIGEFRRFVRATGHRPAGDCRVYDRARSDVLPDPAANWERPGPAPVTDRHPVTCVSWRDAQAYAAWLTKTTGRPYRLPSEAEWEYAAKAGATTPYPWGADPNAGCAWANIRDRSAAPTTSVAAATCRDGFPESAPAGSFRANAFGLHDMVGNIWEWVEDCYVAPYAADAPTDGAAYQVTGACPRRSVRGGSWITQLARDRPVWRGRDPEDLVNWIFGFRIARDLVDGDRGMPQSRRR